LHLQFKSACRITRLEELTLLELDDAATPGLNRENGHNRRLFKKKLRLLEKGKYQNGRMVRFEWERVNRWRMGSS